MQERTITISKNARYFLLGNLGNTIHELWLVCHGYGQLAESFLRNFSTIDDGTRLIVAPEGLSRFYLAGFRGRIGASWMTKEDRENEINDYVAYLDAVCSEVIALIGLRPDKMVSFGFSQGGATASRWAARSVFPIDRLVIWGSSLPPDCLISPLKLSTIPINFFIGNRDDFITDSEAQNQRRMLKKSGLNFSVIEYDGGHEIPPEALLTCSRL
jgi:predicted esterase